MRKIAFHAPRGEIGARRPQSFERSAEALATAGGNPLALGSADPGRCGLVLDAGKRAGAGGQVAGGDLNERHKIKKKKKKNNNKKIKYK
jgi:hypothetical protein